MNEKLSILYLSFLLVVSCFIFSCKKNDPDDNTTPTTALIYKRWIIDTIDELSTSEAVDEDTILLDFRQDQSVIISFITDGFNDNDSASWFWSQDPFAVVIPNDDDTTIWPVINLSLASLWLQTEEGFIKCSPF